MTIEGMFEYAQIEEEFKVTCAVFHLKGDAGFWWKNMKSIRNVQGMTWEQFTQLFFEKYFSETDRTNKVIEFTQLRQTGSVADYARRFESLSRFAMYLVSTDKTKIHHFVQGLKVEI
ncbi:hypothetical protein AJ87_00290 [Rhizobium yanglingense]|nr:hypothetical protein AJ87_00290 [Rhizobium yanglingense]